MAGGPYLVSGGIPLTEQIITPVGHGYQYRDGRGLPQAEEYALCRCGRTAVAPFCDGSHARVPFSGLETASRAAYDQRARILDGPDLDLLDDGRCALARFCHRQNGDAWQLTRESDDPENRSEAIQAANECPSGRLVAMDKDGCRHEPDLAPAINILQDPAKRVSGGIFVQGHIPIETADGAVYEVRNRITLCRCGQSHNKPFCDASHIMAHFKDRSRPGQDG